MIEDTPLIFIFKQFYVRLHFRPSIHSFSLLSLDFLMPTRSTIDGRSIIMSQNNPPSKLSQYLNDNPELLHVDGPVLFRDSTNRLVYVYKGS